MDFVFSFFFVLLSSLIMYDVSLWSSGLSDIRISDTKIGILSSILCIDVILLFSCLVFPQFEGRC